MAEAKILVVDDEVKLKTALVETLIEHGYEAAGYTSGHEALAALREQAFDVLISDLMMPEMGGIALLQAGLDIDPDLVGIIMTGQGTIQTAVEAMKLGAFDYVLKPFKLQTFLPILTRAIQVRHLRLENQRLHALVQERFHFDRIITASDRMRKVLQQGAQIAPTESTVCIYGESGTGKELIAKAIHLASRRAQGPFVAINCGAIPEGLLENELFGHVKGAYTGADRVKRGLLQQAEGGTLFLDEVGELPTTLQVKLLRVLQEREFYAVGAEHPTTVDIRLVAATNQDLSQAVAAGKFREDLYYRLHVIPLFLPPLRERPEDIPLLTDHFLQHWGRAMGKEAQGVTQEALDRLMEYKWPGNVRELANVIERAVVLASTSMITSELLLLGGRQESPTPRPALAPLTEACAEQASEPPDPVLEPLTEARAEQASEPSALVLESLAAAREEVEQAYLIRVLKATKGNVSQAAKLAGMHRGHFYNLMQKYALDPGAFKGEKISP